jgi:hypothetical protein
MTGTVHKVKFICCRLCEGAVYLWGQYVNVAIQSSRAISRVSTEFKPNVSETVSASIIGV